MRDYFKKFKSKWGIKSNFQLIIILVVFAITGSCSLFVTEPLLNLLNIKRLIHKEKELAHLTEV